MPKPSLPSGRAHHQPATRPRRTSRRALRGPRCVAARAGLRLAGSAAGLCGPAAVRDLAQPLRHRIRRAAGGPGRGVAAGAPVRRRARPADRPLVSTGSLRDRIAPCCAVAPSRRWCWPWACGACCFRRPPCRPPATALLAWAGVLMAITYTAYSVMSVAHQAWGARLGGTEVQRSRIVAWREGLALLGVLTAAVLPGTLGLGVTVSAFAVLLALGWWAWSRSVRPPCLGTWRAPRARCPRSRRCASPASCACSRCSCSTARPARFPPRWCCFSCKTGCRPRPRIEPAFLAIYFLMAALSLPAVGARCAPARAGPHLAGGHGAGGAGVHLGRHAGRGRHRAVSDRLRACRAWPWAPTWPCPARCSTA